ncbi:hypothetical protein [Novipirellula galeiformis]|nr:hypothetical protein [Novipirellula galeiformis]
MQNGPSLTKQNGREAASREVANREVGNGKQVVVSHGGKSRRGRQRLGTWEHKPNLIEHSSKQRTAGWQSVCNEIRFQNQCGRMLGIGC